MDDVKGKNIPLYFENIPEDVEALYSRLGEAAIAMSDDVSKCSDTKQFILVSTGHHFDWAPNLAGKIHPEHLSHPALEYLLRRSHNKEYSVDLNESFEEFDKEVHSYRFIDPFEEGEIGDAMAQKIMEAGFDPLPFRSFHTALMGYVAHHVKRSNFLLPIDLQVGLFQGSVVVQCVVSSSLFTSEQIKESLKENDINHPYQSMLRQCFESCHILDIAYLDHAKKVILTGVWCHEQYGLPSGTILFRSIDRLGVILEKLKKDNELHLVFGKSATKFDELRLSGEGPRHYGPDEFIETDHPYIVKMIVDHCVNKLEKLNEQAPMESEGLVRLLEDFADKGLLAKLNAKDWQNALHAIQDVSAREILENSVDNIVDGADEDIFERVVSTLTRMSFDEAKTVVSGKVEEDKFKQIVAGHAQEEDDTQNIIPGVTEDLTEARNLIKGKREDLGDQQHKTVVKGGGGDPLAGKGEFNVRISSAWEDKKKNVLNKLRDKWVIAKENGSSRVDLEQEMRLVMSEELHVDEEIAGQLVRGVVAESKDEVLAEKTRTRAEELRSQMQETRFKQELAKRDQQILKMKKIMDQVKSELAHKNKTISENGNSTTTVIDSNNDEQLVLMQQEVSRVSKELLEARQQLEHKEREIDLREKQVGELEKKLDYFREKSGETQEQKAKIHGLKRENVSLQNQANLHQTRVEHLSARLEKQKNDFENRDRDELEKTQERLAQLESERQKMRDQLTRFEFMNRELEKKLVDKENELMRNRQSEAATTSASSEEAHKQALKEVEELKARERELQQEAKTQALKVRQLEQKLKFTTAQLDKQSARSTQGNGGGASSAIEKRLEAINKKLSEGMKSQAAEVAERKKEVVKLKAENNQLQHKLTELERQLSKFSKAS